MPTATDVDNRPLAIGKWPRLRRNNQNALRRPRTAHLDGSDEGRGTVRQYHHRDWCTLDDCVHSCDEGSNICTDILLQPELLQEFYGDRGLSSSNPLLEFCLDGGFVRKCSAVFPPEGATAAGALPSLLAHCSSCSTDKNNNPDFVTTLSQLLRQTGCDINVQDPQGKTALHHLIQGCSKENFAIILESIKLLMGHGPNLDLVDNCRRKDTVFTKLHVLLDRGLSPESLVELVQTLLLRAQTGGNVVDQFNAQERNLLSYTVALGDSVLELTRCLLNHGAQVLPARCSIIRDRSAFTWLVRSIMNRQSLEGHRETLNLLCQNMASDPEVMRTHVLSTMIHLGHSATVMAPLFIQLRALVSPYWAQPLPLIQLCRSSIRHSLGPKNVAVGVTRLSLPPSLTQYLHYFQ